MTARNGLFVRYCAKDFLDGTQTLDVWEELAYRRICDLIYATNDGLVDDDRKLAWMTKVGKRWPVVKAALIRQGKIRVENGLITNRRCQEELGEAGKKIEACAHAGRKSAERRKSLRNNETVATNVGADVPTDVPTDGATNHLTPNHREKEPNGSSSQTRASALAALRAEFDAVWKQYPRRVDKDSAFKAYARARKSGAPADEIMRGVMRYGQECADRAPRYIKHFATYLNAGSWNNEPDPDTPSRSPAEPHRHGSGGPATGRGLDTADARAAILRGVARGMDARRAGAGDGDPLATGGD